MRTRISFTVCGLILTAAFLLIVSTAGITADAHSSTLKSSNLPTTIRQVTLEFRGTVVIRCFAIDNGSGTLDLPAA